MAGVPVDEIVHFEAGRRAPPPDVLRPLAEALGVTVRWLTTKPPRYRLTAEDRAWLETGVGDGLEGLD